MHRSSVLAALAAALAAASAFAADIRVQCYSDGNECEVTADLAKRFEARNPGTKVIVDKVPYKAVTDTLPVQLAAGEGPDIARVTDLGGLQVLPRSHAAARCAREILGGQLRADAQVAARGAVGQGHLRDDDAAHGHGHVRQQDVVRAGWSAAAR